VVRLRLDLSAFLFCDADDAPAIGAEDAGKTYLFNMRAEPEWVEQVKAATAGWA